VQEEPIKEENNIGPTDGNVIDELDGQKTLF
jgi:hypothetical protein